MDPTRLHDVAKEQTERNVRAFKSQFLRCGKNKKPDIVRKRAPVDQSEPALN